MGERPDTTEARVRRVAHCVYERPERPDLALSKRYTLIEGLDVSSWTFDFAVRVSDEFMAEVEAGRGFRWRGCAR